MKKKHREWKEVCYHADLIRVYGGILIFIATWMIILFFLMAKAPCNERLEISLPGSLILLLIGIGILLQYRIIAALFSLLTLSIGITLLVAGITEMAESWLLFIPLLLSTLFFLPAVSVVIGWKALK